MQPDVSTPSKFLPTYSYPATLRSLIRERQSCKTGVGEEVTNAEKYLLSGIAYYISTSLFSLFMTIFS
ncbi:MAG: hypothetical protein WKF91_00525 [Segetibacter sp.]